MKYGIGAARFGDNIEEAFRLAPEIGFDGLEIPFNRVEDHEEEFIWSRDGVEKLRAWAEGYGVEMPSCVAGRYNKRGFPDDDRQVRKEAEVLMVHLIDMCAEAGIHTILTPFFGDQVLDDEERIERAIDGLKQCAPHAESRGVTLALEGTVDAETWLRIIEAIDSRAVGVYYDVGNAARYRLDGPEELRVLSEERVLEQIHIKDMTLDHRNMPLGEGDVDWYAVVGAINQIEYDGYLVLETPMSENPCEDYAAWLEFIKSRTGE